MQPSQRIDVSIVVPCRNEIRHIRAFLDCVFRQKLEGLEMEVLIADGMSNDGTREVLAQYEKKYAALKIMDNPEKIVSTAANRAIRAARGDIIVRMDVHTRYAPDYVRSSVQALHETGAGNVGGPALTDVNGYVAEAIAHAFHSPFASGGAKYRDPSYEGPVASVPYGCFHKSTLESVGLYDEDLVCGQDVELNFRITSAGRMVWQSPKIVSWYTPRASFTKLFRQYFQYGFWKIGILRKHRRVLAWRSLAPVSCLVAVSGLIVAVTTANLRGDATLRNAFLVAFLSLIGIYSTASFAAAFSVARRRGWRFLPILPAIFVGYQLPYALGSLLALVFRPTLRDLPEPVRKMVMATTR